jgi:hypothetical protein
MIVAEISCAGITMNRQFEAQGQRFAKWSSVLKETPTSIGCQRIQNQSEIYLDSKRTTLVVSPRRRERI